MGPQRTGHNWVTQWQQQFCTFRCLIPKFIYSFQYCCTCSWHTVCYLGLVWSFQSLLLSYVGNVRKIPWRRKWQPTPVLLPGKSTGQRSIMDYSPLCCRVGCNWAHLHTAYEPRAPWSLRLKVRWVSEVAQSCPTLCDPMDCSLRGCSVHGILQARTLQWVAISFSRGSSRPRDQTRVSCIAGRRFTLWATREAQSKANFSKSWLPFANKVIPFKVSYPLPIYYVCRYFHFSLW